MNFAALLIPPSLEAKQSLRLNRLGIAALTYAIASALVATAWFFSVLPAFVAMEFVAACLALNAGLYLAIRTGYNLRFDDPSMTRFQILAAITVLMYVVYHMREGREIALFGCFIVFLFGIFRFNAREFTIVTLYTLAAYALVINLLMHWRPQAIHDVYREWLSWLGLAGFLPCFAIIGGKINRLRRVLRMREAAKQAAIVNALSAHIALLDAQGQILSVNEAWRRFADTDLVHVPGHRIGVNYLAICDHAEGDGAAEAHRIAAGIRSVLGGENERFSVEYPCVSPTQQRWFRVTMTPLNDADLMGAVVMHLDVTAQRQTEENLRASETRFRQMAENIHDVFFLIDARSNRPLYISPAYEQIWGRPAESVYTDMDAWTESIHPEDRESTQEKFNTGLTAGRIEYEYRIVRPDGTIRWIETRGFPVRNDNGRIVRIAGVAKDVTERKQAETALRQLNEELEDKVTMRTVALQRARHDAEVANQAKSTFLAAMSHEIRTPMNGVVGMIDVLHQTSLKGDQVEMVDIIRDSAFSLLSVINDILDFSKIEAGRMELEREAFTVGDVVEGVCSLLNGMAEKKDVALTQFIDPAIPADIVGDNLRLRQVLINLVNNAIKFSSGQTVPGRVSVRALLVEQNPQQVMVEFRVADNGIGMDNETRGRVFTPFTQADASTTRRFGGTGLGLAIAHHLVHLMGGEIVVQSEPGDGAVFTARLPFALMASASNATKEVPEVAGISCVVVGERQGLAGDLAGYLKHANAIVVCVPDLADARRHTTGSTGMWVWIVDAFDAGYTHEQIQAVRAQIAADTRVVVVLIERGKRRRPRAGISDMFIVDGNSLKRRTFLNTIAVAAGRASLHPDADGAVIDKFSVIAPSREEALRQARLILVAEDNETNQKVILRQLALLGYAADIAADGREALERWSSGEYALLLTDLHMPEMDGYELTQAIRAEEKDGNPIPIIALTANALKGEAERCRAAGMDDYRTKPSPLAELKAVLDKWLPIAQRAGEAPYSAWAPAQHAADVAVDIDVLVALVGDEPALVHDFLQDFRISMGGIAVELRACCVSGQTHAAAAAAHKLKSSARAVGALALGELCAAIEEEGQAGDRDALSVLLPRFDTEMAAVEDYLDKRVTHAASASAPLAAAQEAGSTNPTGMNILLVDDEPFMLKLHMRLLANLGYPAAVPCEGAVCALETMDTARTPPDLILLDLSMPDMDGVEFLRHLVKRGYAGSIILVSGEDERMLQASERLVQAHQITALGHLSKPVKPEILAAFLQKWKPVHPRHASAATRTYTAHEVRAAIDNGELVNYYQPKVSLATGRVMGVETLVRWKHPLHGLVLPEQFISVAEAHGLICDLTRQVIAGALTDLKVWQQETGLALQVAVNISMDDLALLDFADYVFDQTVLHNVPPNQVVLEVTESKLMRDLRIPLEILTRLRLKRFRISIDDFGTGHSSLAQLRELPFDELKIDRGFVHRAWADETVRAIFDSSVMLAKQMKMDIVAEGVEDRMDWDFMRRSGCDVAQGNFIAKPMPAEALYDWMQTLQQRVLVAA